MKKTTVFVLFSLLSLLLGCASINVAPMPEWVLNYQKEFPGSTYIAQKGTGKTADNAKSEAAASLSYYFDTTVNANRESNYRSFETTENGKYSTKSERETKREIKVTTDTALRAVEYTEPWYSKKDKTWHCVAYLVRETAWKNFEPSVRLAKDNFTGYYNKAMEEKEPFERLRLLGIARTKGSDFMDAISYAQFLSEPLTNTNFQADILLLSELSSRQQEEKGKIPIFLEVENDSASRMYGTFAKAFAECGFKVTKERSESVYTAKAKVESEQVVQDELIIATPSVRLSLVGKNGSVYSYAKSGNRVKAYTQSLLEKKSLESLCPVVEQTFFEDFNAVLSGRK